VRGLRGSPPRPISGGIPGPFKAGGSARDTGDGRTEGAAEVGTSGALASTLVLTGPTDESGVEFTVVVVAGTFVGPVLAPDTTGGVEDPSLDGIDIEDSEDVDETGEGIAVTLFETPLLVAVLVPELGANKFVIVGECFLLPLVTPGS
jgi:hypothetical protein